VRRRGLLLHTGATIAAAAFASLPLEARAQTAEGTLLLNAGAEPDTIDPARTSFIGEIEKVMRVFRNLLTWDAKGALVPDQAAALPTLGNNGTELTFTLKPGLSYSDGRPLTARDFEYGWKRHLDPLTRSEYAFAGHVIRGALAYNTADPAQTPAETLRQLRDAVGVRALDDRTLRFDLVAPAPWFLSVLATWCGVPMREDLITRAGDRWTEPATYIGNGPYVLAEWDHSSRMRFEANSLYKPAPPPIPAIEYAMIGEAAIALAAYFNDELDIVGVQIEDRPRVQSDARLRAEFHEYVGNCSFYVGFNTRQPPFDNPNVRGAFARAFDRVSYVRNLLGGQGRPARQFVPVDFPGYFEAELEEQVYDPAAARARLAAAGFPEGRGLPRIKWGYTASARGRQRIEALAEQVRSVLGVQVEPDPLESRAFTAALKSPSTTPQMFFTGWCQDYPDPQNWYSAVFNSRSPLGRTGWQSDAFDRLTNAADAELDATRRRTLYRDAAQILLNESPAAFLYHSVVWLLVKPRLRGFREDPFEYFLGEHDLAHLTLA
jgi:oligopeptide transport system substrate-binding protein